LQEVLARFGSTGCLEAISKAVELRPPLLTFPVADIDTLASLTLPPGANRVLAGTAGASPGPLGDCLLMRPGSQVEDLYNSLKQLRFVDGECDVDAELLSCSVVLMRASTA
jgi:hypothetical protein